MQAVQHCSDMCRLLKARILSCSWQPITSPRWNSYLHFLLPSNEQWNVFPLLCRHDDDRSMFMSKRKKFCWYQLLYKSRLPGRTKLAQRSPPVTACTEPGSNISVRWADKTFSSGLDRNSYQKTIFYPKQSLQYFSSALADSEHRIMLAEDAIGGNKTRARLGPPEIEPSYAHRSFR